MANKSIQRVQAIDIDSNSIVDCDTKDVVEIKVVPLVSNPYGGDGSPIIPATERLIGTTHWPTRLLGILPALNNRERPWPLVRYECKSFKCWADGPVRSESKCYVRNESDARDHLFHKLTDRERACILKAVQVRS